MLAVILAASVFTGSISADSVGVVREDSAFFLSEAQGNSAKVVAKNKTSNSALQAACRRALTLPKRYELRQSLEAKTAQTLPASVSYIDANIANFKHSKISNGLHCQGDVNVSDLDYNHAGLALNVAWQAADEGNIDLLRPMLKLALNHSKTQADAVALIASQTDLASGLAYLDQHLSPQKLTLNQGKLAVGKMWFSDKRYQAAIDILATCDEPMCRQIRFEAESKLARLQSDDLSSYF